MGVVAFPDFNSGVQAALGSRALPCLSSLAVGDLVYITTGGSAEKIDRTDIAKMPAVGVVTAKSTPLLATIQFIGPVSVYTGLTEGAEYFAGSDGRPVSPLSKGPTETIFTQSIGFALDSTTLFLKPDATTKRMK
jgi:hypothetical protein